jgi:uncharacterized protein
VVHILEGWWHMFYLFTHNDLDGIGCGILAKIAFGDKAEVRYNSISRLDFQVQRFLEKFNKKDQFCVTDLSVNEENANKMDSLYKKGAKINLIDHHKTALHFNDFPWGFVQVANEAGELSCATSLLYEHLKQEDSINSTKALDEFVELVRLYDTWEWERKGNLKAKQLNDLFSLFSLEEFQEMMLTRLHDQEDFQFNDFEVKILQLEEEKIQRYLWRKKRETTQVFIDDFCVGIVHGESYHSELGNELGKLFPHLDYIAIMNVGGKRISLRTIHDRIDVSQIAGKYGGGGHAKASGCTMREGAFEQYVVNAFKGEPIMADADQNVQNVKESAKGTLYENRKKEQYFIQPVIEKNWLVHFNGEVMHQQFDTFAEAEEYIKRQHCAWLSRDEALIDFLANQDISIEKTKE